MENIEYTDEEISSAIEAAGMLYLIKKKGDSAMISQFEKSFKRELELYKKLDRWGDKKLYADKQVLSDAVTNIQKAKKYVFDLMESIEMLSSSNHFLLSMFLHREDFLDFLILDKNVSSRNLKNCIENIKKLPSHAIIKAHEEYRSLKRKIVKDVSGSNK